MKDLFDNAGRVENNMYFTGGTIIFDHGHGVSTLFMHMKDVNVKVGQIVKQGDIRSPCLI